MNIGSLDIKLKYSKAIQIMNVWHEDGWWRYNEDDVKIILPFLRDTIPEFEVNKYSHIDHYKVKKSSILKNGVSVNLDNFLPFFVVCILSDLFKEYTLDKKSISRLEEVGVECH